MFIKIEKTILKCTNVQNYLKNSICTTPSQLNEIIVKRSPYLYAKTFR